jgi:predicted ATPase/DNA-binding winged helix-turn-helix (wHTH) protein
MIMSVSESDRQSPSEEARRPHLCYPRSPFEAEGHVENPDIGQNLSGEASQTHGFPTSAILFGPFRLFPTQRLLLEADKPVRLGSRALDILIALVERAGDLVGKEELMARVWPKTFVEPANLTVHISALRRALGDDRGGNRFLVNIPGRGYRFVAPVIFEENQRSDSHPAAAEQAHNLPALLTRPVGRADILSALAALLPRNRLITLVGPGGIGKTTVALTVADALIATFAHGIRLIDLAPLSDPLLVPSAIASVLGVEVYSRNPVLQLVAFLRDKQILLVLDSCEHMIESVASLTMAVLKGAPNLHILTTSREPLTVQGEHVYRLPPLQTPPQVSGARTAANALNSPAVQLFVERAMMSLGGFELSDAEAPIVAEICSKLDGIPLAIELAAARVAAFGIRALAMHLNDRLQILTTGRRTAPPRHLSLRATLDWSYDWLSELERVVLRRLSIFAGGFSSEAASAVATGPGKNLLDAVDCLTSLVKKSLVSADVTGKIVRYRLLDTTRAYLLEKLNESGEFDEIARRHAEFYRDTLQQAEAKWETLSTSERIADYYFQLDNLRVALEWALSSRGDSSIGVALTVSSVPLWYQFSLMHECRRRVERVLANSQGERLSMRHEMQLYAALGRSILYSEGLLPQADAAWTRVLKIAERLKDSEFQLRALWGIWVCRTHSGQFAAALALAKKFFGLANDTSNSANVLLGNRLMGFSLHYAGNQASARRHLGRVLAASSHHSLTGRYGFDQSVLARMHLARILWLQGLPDQALHTVHSNVDSAQAAANELLLCYVLAESACPVSILVGDLSKAERYATMLNDCSEELALGGWWSAWGRCLKGAVSIKRGEFAIGLELLCTSLQELRDCGFGLRYTELLSTLAEGLSLNGQIADGLVAIDRALEQCEREEERWIMAELLRIKGEILLSKDKSTTAKAEEYFIRSLDCAREQRVLAWELRTAISLARLQRDSGCIRKALDLLMPVYRQFSEGFGTADLKSAKSLLDELT